MPENAAKMCGGKQFIRQRIIARVRDTVDSLGLDTEEFGLMAYPANARILDRLRESPERLNEDIALSLMAPLAIPIEDVLLLREMTKPEHDDWLRTMLGSDDSVLATSGGDGTLDPEVCLALFIRFEAMKELNTP